MEQVKKVLVAKNDDNTLAGIVIIYKDKKNARFKKI